MLVDAVDDLGRTFHGSPDMAERTCTAFGATTVPEFQKNKIKPAIVEVTRQRSCRRGVRRWRHNWREPVAGIRFHRANIDAAVFPPFPFTSAAPFHAEWDSHCLVLGV